MSEITNANDQTEGEAAAAAALTGQPVAPFVPYTPPPAATPPASTAAPVSNAPVLNPSTPYAPEPAPAPTTVALPDENQSARQIIDDQLAQWGLSGLSGTAWELIQGGATNAEVLATIRKAPEYAQRFAGNVQRQQAGYTPLSETDYLDREEQLRAQMIMGGLPSGFWDQPSDFADFIGRAVSVEEIAQRITQGYTRVANASPFTRSAFQEYFGPSGNSALAAFFLDPTGEKSLPVLERMATEAEIGGAATRFGIGADLATAQRLAGLGVTGSEALQGYQRIAGLASTFTPTIGEANDLTAATTGVASVLEGDAAATEAIRKRQGARQAAFDQTGGALTTGQGVLGLGVLK